MVRFNPEHSAPQPPPVHPERVEDSERSAADSLRENLHGIAKYADQFAVASALCGTCEENRRNDSGPDKLWSDWSLLAMQQGVVCLYNYSMAMSGVFSLIRSNPKLFARVNRVELDQQRVLFKNKFPNLKELRQTLLHGAELYQSAQRRSENTITKGFYVPGLIYAPFGGDKITIRDASVNTTYCASFAGKAYTYDIDSGSVETLITITRRFFEAFPSGLDIRPL